MKIHNLYQKSYWPYTKWKISESYFQKLPEHYSFNYQELKDYLGLVTNEVGLIGLNTPQHPDAYTSGYRGLGFTYRECSNDPHHDAFKIFNEKEEYFGSATSKRTMKSLLDNQAVHRFERDFVEKTKFYSGPLERVLSKFKSQITKVRLIELKAGESVHEHFDYPYYENVRIHASILTNENVFWWVEDKKFSIPADGNFYWFDTGRFHKIENNGDTPRLILSVHLSVYKNIHGDQIYDENVKIEDLINQCKF